MTRVQTTIFAAAASLGAALVTGGCAMMDAPGSRYAPPPAGSTYVRVERNTGSFGNGTRQLNYTVERRVWNGVEVAEAKSQVGSLLFTNEGRLIAFLDPAGKAIIAWDPPEEGYGMRFPLEVGKTWTESGKMTLSTGRVVPHDNACRVEGEEEITIPAGTFKTFKVLCKSSRGHDYTQWYAPSLGLSVKQIQVRAAHNPFGGAGTREDEIVAINIKR